MVEGGKGRLFKTTRTMSKGFAYPGVNIAMYTGGIGYVRARNLRLVSTAQASEFNLVFVLFYCVL